MERKKGEKMNKYQEALNEIKNCNCENCYCDSMGVIEVLVERATPMKPLDIHTPVVKWGLCPACKGELNKFHGRPNRVLENEAYCRDCGQALDWSEEE